MPKLQAMMHEMRIDSTTPAAVRCVPTIIFENRSVKQSPHQHHNTHPQQQQRNDQARLFYKLRQKRKQRRLQRGPLHVDARLEQRAQATDRVCRGQKRESKLVTVIVGSSLARHVSVKNVENDDNEVRLRFKSGSDCADALAWLTSNEGQFFMRDAHQVIFILGTNDLHRVGAFQTAQRIGNTVTAVRRLFPRVNIVWQLLQQRTRKTWLLPEGPAVLHEIEKCNVFLIELAAKLMFETIQPAIPIHHMYDGLHPSRYGVQMMEKTIRDHLQKQKMPYPSSFSIDSRRIHANTPPPLMSINFHSEISLLN